MRGLLRSVGLAVCASLALAAPAHADSFGDSATSCDGRKVEQPFLRWLDPMRYACARPERRPRARRDRHRARGRRDGRAGNETFYVGGAGDSRSLYLPAGARRPRAPCASSFLHPTIRYFAKNHGARRLPSLRVDALIEDPLTGRVLTLPVGVHTGGRSWHPSLPGLVLADFLSLLGDDGELAVAFRFKPIGLPRDLADRRRLRRSVQEPLGRRTTRVSSRASSCRRARGRAAPPRGRPVFAAPRPARRARPCATAA